jgi:aspartate carbamoyltransferase catalytic subunit
MRIAIVGDIKHSRVARSCTEAFTLLGAEVILVAPSTLLPPDHSPWTSNGKVRISGSLDEVIDQCDVMYMLRMQRERMAEALVPNLAEYSNRFGLDRARASRLKTGALVMHPGPMNRGVEILVDPADLPGSVVTNQVTNGVSVRMAVLFDVLGGSEAEVNR